MMAWLLAFSSQYLPGDPVPMMRRTQYKGRRTAWHEVPHRASPIFLTDRESILDVTALDVEDGEPFKVSLAFEHQEITTPWIAVADGKGRYLSHLELFLTAEGDSLAGYGLSRVLWRGEYVEMEPPERVTMRTQWEHHKEIDLELALTMLFTVTAIITYGICFYTCKKHGAGAYAELFGDAEDEPAHAQHTRRDPAPRHRPAAGQQIHRGVHRDRQRAEQEIQMSDGYYGRVYTGF